MLLNYTCKQIIIDTQNSKSKSISIKQKQLLLTGSYDPILDKVRIYIEKYLISGWEVLYINLKNGNSVYTGNKRDLEFLKDILFTIIHGREVINFYLKITNNIIKFNKVEIR